MVVQRMWPCSGDWRTATRPGAGQALPPGQNKTQCFPRIFRLVIQSAESVRCQFRGRQRDKWRRCGLTDEGDRVFRLRLLTGRIHGLWMQDRELVPVQVIAAADTDIALCVREAQAERANSAVRYRGRPRADRMHLQDSREADTSFARRRNRRLSAGCSPPRKAIAPEGPTRRPSWPTRRKDLPPPRWQVLALPTVPSPYDPGSSARGSRPEPACARRFETPPLRAQRIFLADGAKGVPLGPHGGSP